MDWQYPSSTRPSKSAWGFSIFLLLLPGVMLGVAASRYGSSMLSVGAISVLLGASLFARCRAVWRPPASGTVILLYLISLGWLWFATRVNPDAFARFTRGLFVFVAIGLLIVHDLIRTGVEPRRIARKLSNRLFSRVRWPHRLMDIATLPEVVKLRAAVREDPSLVFDLLEDRRVEVQTAALCALQSRRYWRWEEGAVLLAVARKSQSPEVRMLAATALGTADNLDLISGVSELLRDPISEVREAACGALLAGGEKRWAMVRNAIRTNLSDPTFAKDGPLPGCIGNLSPLAVCDLTGWTSEPAPLSERAVQTLLTHYHACLKSGLMPSLASDLGGQVTDNQTPPVLRVELAGLLRDHGVLTQELLDRMTDPDQPSAVRLLAVGIQLATDPGDAAALDVLRGLGRQSNRDTAVSIARILQKHLHTDFGVPKPGEPIAIKLAAEVTAKVQRWANAKPGMGALEETPMPMDDASIPGKPSPFGPATRAASVPGVINGRRNRTRDRHG